MENTEKCLFCKRNMKFLGYVISDDKISVDPNKMKAVVKITPSEDK